MATVKELREQAKAYGIKGYSRMKKAELEAVLSDAQAEKVPAATDQATQPEVITVLHRLVDTRDFAEFKAMQAENVAAIMKCETLSELQALLKPLDMMSTWMSVRPAMIAICGEAPDGMLGGRKGAASLIMQARAHARAKSF